MTKATWYGELIPQTAEHPHSQRALYRSDSSHATICGLALSVPNIHIGSGVGFPSQNFDYNCKQ